MVSSVNWLSSFHVSALMLLSKRGKCFAITFEMSSMIARYKSVLSVSVFTVFSLSVVVLCRTIPDKGNSARITGNY